MRLIALPAAALLPGLLFLSAQDSGGQLKQRFAELRQAVAENQKKLRAYHWVETTELSLKGEVKNRKQTECRYGADGQIERTEIGGPSEPKKAPGGLRGKMAKKKTEEFADYMERFGSLLSRYIPPDTSRMQVALQAGRVNLEQTPGSPLASLVFRDYAKSGDTVTFTFDTAAKKLNSFNVATYLDSPEDAVGVDVRFSALADGTRFPEDVVLTSKSKQLQVRRTNFDYKKAGQ